MSNLSENEFIDSLVGNLNPTDVLMSAEKRTIIWLVLHTILISGIMFLTNPYQIEIIKNLNFNIEILGFITLIILSTYFSFLSAVPGSLKPNKYKVIFIPLFILIASLFFGIVTNNHVAELRVTGRSFCEVEILLYSLPAFLHNVYLLSKGFFTNKPWSFAFASLSSAMIPAAIMHYACVYNPTHVLTFHILPVVAISIFSAIVVSKFINRKRKDTL